MSARYASIVAGKCPPTLLERAKLGSSGGATDQRSILGPDMCRHSHLAGRRVDHDQIQIEHSVTIGAKQFALTHWGDRWSAPNGPPADFRHGGSERLGDQVSARSFRSDMSDPSLPCSNPVWPLRGSQNDRSCRSSDRFETSAARLPVSQRRRIDRTNIGSHAE